MKRNDFPKEMSVYEASDFWDEHGFDEFEDVREAKGVRFLLRKKKYVGIDMDLYSLIRNKAKTMGKAEDTLISEWLSEKAGSMR